MGSQPTFTDGNSFVGPMSDLFAVDISVAEMTCVGCGRRSRAAQLRVYATGPGTVARCPGCDDPMLRYVRTSTAAVLDLRGTLTLSVPIPATTA
jgi:hypothetical protein